MRKPKAVLVIFGVALLFAGLAWGPPGAPRQGASCRSLKATILGTKAHDVLIGTDKRDVIVGLEGNDSINSKGGPDVVCGNRGDDKIFGGRGKPSRHSSTADVLVGNAGNDVIYGANLVDFLEGGPGADVLHGGDGRDYIYGYAESVSGGESDDGDRMYGGDGRDFFNAEGGFPPDYCCNADGGDDVMHGGEGNDVLAGGQGSDSLDGGKGMDWAAFDSATAADLNSGIASSAQGTDALIRIENLQGSETDDSLIGDDGPNKLADSSHYQRSGNDTLDGRGGEDDLQTFFGNDIALGGDGNDLIDIICCLEETDGDDLFSGGPGDDVVYGGMTGEDTFDGGDGIDLVSWLFLDEWSISVDLEAETASTNGWTFAVRSIESVHGGYGNDTLLGDSQDNALNGDLGDDLIDGRACTDSLDGGAGLDTCLNGEELKRCES